MKKNHLFILLIALANSITKLSAQIINPCGQSIVTENIYKNNPLLKQEYLKLIQENASEQSTIAFKTASAPIYTIPMVFHILHTGGPENISDAQVIDEVAILNRDYQKKNADTNVVVPSFTNNIANVGIAFKLATIDPDGNCTNGIIRHYTPNTIWDANNLGLFTYSWPRDKYLNVYVVKSINIAATAYAFLPGTAIPPAADVIVSLHNMIGSIGTGNVANSRVITHEAAHWLNLQHIWGTSNQPGVACGDDAVSDTPITKGFVTCSTSNATICNPPIQENVQNYMDYSPCKIMFTNGQAARMIACLTGTVNNRLNIYSPSNLLATGVTASLSNCTPSIELAVIPSQTVCAGQAITISSYSSNANPTSYLWSATNGATIANTSSPNANITFINTGNSTVTCVASNSNGATTSSIVITAVNSLVNVVGNYSESFENGTLPNNWMVINQTSSSALWNINNFAASDGSQSMFVNGETAPGASIEILETPSYDFLNNPGATYTFKYAYARKTATHKDVFKVQASKDCGGSWMDIYVPSASSMASGSGGTTANLFIPSAAEWKQYDITQHPNFSSLLYESNVRLRFYFREDSLGFGNRMYLDEINFTSPVGINEFTKHIGFNVFPNPANENVNITFSLSEPKKVMLCLLDAIGNILIKKETSEYHLGINNVEIPINQNIGSGIYFIKMECNGISVVKKIVIDR